MGATIIRVDVTHEEELVADGFDLFVTVRGSSVFTGRAAFEKAAEVKSLVEGVRVVGLGRDDVSLVGVQVDVESGLLSKSSSARYSLRMRAGEVERLADVLTAVASAKNATVDRLVWRYPEGEDARQAWLRAAVASARGRADAIAGGLGLRVTGVRRVITPVAPPMPRPVMLGAPQAAPTRGRGGSVDLGVDVAPTRQTAIDVRVDFVAVSQD